MSQLWAGTLLWQAGLGLHFSYSGALKFTHPTVGMGR